MTAWPDHDPDGGGRKAMVTALRLAATAGAIVRGIVAVPEDFPAKFDLANEWPEADADPEARIRELIARAEPVETGGTQPLGRILSGADFAARHVPPAWLIDGIVQRSRLYTCTSRTDHGKTAVWLFNGCMIHAGRKIGSLDTLEAMCFTSRAEPVRS